MSNQLQEVQGGNLAFASGALANGTTTATIKTTVIVPYVVESVFASKAITDNIAPTNGLPAGGAFATQAAGTTCLYGVDIDAAGAVTVIKGDEVLTADISAGVRKCPLPSFPPRTRTRIGIIKVANATNPFIFGTTGFAAAGVTTTYFNTSNAPSNPASFS